VSKKKPNNIDQLVEQAKKGDTSAFALIYDEMVKPIYRYIYYRVEPQIAEDLTEDTFLKVWQNLSKYKKGKFPFSAWVFRIAHNLVVDYYRSHHIVEEVDESLPDPSESRNPMVQLDVKFTQIRLRKAILKLPNNYQQIIVLKFINDMNNDEIAAATGKTEGAIRTIQFRALKQLRSILDKK